MWMENDKVIIPEVYLKMSPEELKRAKEKEWQRIIREREENINDALHLIYQDMINKNNGDTMSLVEYLKTIDGSFKPVETVSSLKKRIKHCKNPMEKKNLERQLNQLYKEMKKRHD